MRWKMEANLNLAPSTLFDQDLLRVARLSPSWLKLDALLQKLLLTLFQLPILIRSEQVNNGPSALHSTRCLNTNPLRQRPQATINHPPC